MPIETRGRAGALHALLLTACVLAATRADAGAPELNLAIEGAPDVVFNPKTDACDGHDVPDVNARAYRGADGLISMFALHFVNRALRGPDLDHMKIDCSVALASGGNGNPAKYDNQSWITATWTPDGKRVAGLVHHEYHGDRFGTCDTSKNGSGLGCWYNTIIAVNSGDGGKTFQRASTPVVAAAPFRQDVAQGRHRGFFNPSNIFTSGGHHYAFITTTGWPGQHHGTCLFQSDDPSRAGSWRAYDGAAFTIKYEDPYGAATPAPKPCAVIAPFLAAVGAVVRHKPSGVWIAMAHAWKDESFYPVPGFYYATSRDLTHWSDPRLLLATKTLSDDACGADRLRSYPSLLDPDAKDRNFGETGDRPWLYFTDMRVEGCAHTSDRKLTRLRLRVSSKRAEPKP